MLDLRQHLFYFIAIFLMLGVGMLVGASFYGPAQVRQQQKSLAHLRVQVDGAVQEGRDAKALLAKNEAALDSLRPALVHGRLSGKRIVLVQTGDYTDAVSQAAMALRDAGATPAATVVLGSAWNNLDPDARADAVGRLAQVLTGGASTFHNAGVLQTLEDRGLVVVTGSLDARAALFVLVGGGRQDTGLDDSSEAALEPALAQGLQAGAGASARLVGCEEYGADISSMPAFQQAGISTVDCIDRPLGMLALPFALLGGADTGDYGLKATAQRQVPPSLEPTAP